MITAGLSIYSAQRLETLVERLADELATRPLDPLEREVIVVQSRGMYRWVTLELARRLGIAATLATPFPGIFCRALAERIEGTREFAPSERYEAEGQTPFERDPLAWRIFHLLAAGPKRVTAPAASYTKDDPDGRLRFQLASRLAARFDDYQLYRPDLLLAWERGEQPFDGSPQRDTARWQAAIWQSVVEGAGAKNHLARRFTELIELLGQSKSAPRGLPTRVSVFGAASLPPIFLQLLEAVARFAHVGIYVASPTQEFWSDLRTERDAAKQLDLFASRGLAATDAHVEVGNNLLASFGKQGQELETLLQGLDRDGSAREALAAPVPERNTVLGTLQADIIELVERGHGDGREPPLPLPAGDRSLSIHVCHSPMREMQVLRDLILDAFAADPTLRLDEIFVLAPDISTYTPFIQAVFGVAHEGEPPLRFTIADRTVRGEEPLIDAAFRMLDLVKSRLAASHVLALFDIPAVRRAARIDAGEVDTLRAWVTSVPIRWGRDGQQRCDALELRAGALASADAADSWRGGLDRLLLGCAVDTANALVAGILPSPLAAGDTDLLGRFVRFVDRLFGIIESLARERALMEWAHDLGTAFTTLLAPSDEAEDAALTALLDATSRFAEHQELSDCKEAVSIEVVRDALQAEIAHTSGGAGFISGSITFCSLQPMRAIPAKIVAVVGLDDDAFPRRDRPASFDLIPAAPRLGDRSTKADDRYLFLETLLAARERLILSTIGRSQKDNSKLAPSSVLAELTATIDRSFVAADESPASAHLTMVHALQPFSERYFASDLGDEEGPVLPRSFSRAGYEAALAQQRAALAAREGSTPTRAFAERAVGVGERPRDITLADLTEFWVNPSKHFCTRTLGLRLPHEDPTVADSEPFLLAGLERYQLSERVLERRLEGHAPGEDELALLRASGSLPHAELGRVGYDKVREEVDDLVSTLESFFGGRPAAEPPAAIDVRGNDWRLTGTVSGLTDRGRLRYRPTSLKPKDRVRAWISHLALNARAPCSSFLIANRKADDGGKEYFVTHMKPVADAATHLDVLVRGYLDGRERPLPVFEHSSHEFASRTHEMQLGNSNKRTDPFAAADKMFRPSGFGPPRDGDDKHVALTTRDRTMLADERERFKAMSLALWEPLLAASEEIEP